MYRRVWQGPGRCDRRLGGPGVTPATDALPAIAGRRSARVVARSLFALTKPRIIELLLVTTIPTMLLAQRGLPSIRVLLVTLVAGACAAGSANTINCYIDRDIDAIMRRTSRRPLNGKGREAAVIKPAEALVFGILLGDRVHGPARHAGELAVRGAGRHRDLVLRVRLHARPEAPHPVQHRHRGRGGLLPGAHRLVRRDRPGQPARGGPVRGDLLLDPAALLGAGHEVPRRLRRGPGAHAAGGRLTRRGRPEDPLLLLRDGGRPPSPSRPTPAGCTRPRRSRWAAGSSSRRTGCAAGWPR